MPKAAKMPKVSEITEGSPSKEEQLAEIENATTEQLWDEISAHSQRDEVENNESTEEEEKEEQEEVAEPVEPKKSLKDRLGELDETDLEELFKVSEIKERVAQQIEDEAQQRAKELERQELQRLEKERQSQKYQEEQEYLRRLRKTDLAKYNEELDKREAQEEAQQEEVERIRKVTNEFTRRLNVYVDKNVEKPIADSLRTKDYTHLDLVDGIIQYVDDILSARTDATRKSVEKELRPAIKKQLLAEINGKSGTPQPAVGTELRGRAKPNVKDFAYEEEAAEAFQRGLLGQEDGITKEELLEWYKMHPVKARGLF